MSSIDAVRCGSTHSARAAAAAAAAAAVAVVVVCACRCYQTHASSVHSAAVSHCWTNYVKSQTSLRVRRRRRRRLRRRASSTWYVSVRAESILVACWCCLSAGSVADRLPLRTVGRRSPPVGELLSSSAARWVILCATLLSCTVHLSPSASRPTQMSAALKSGILNRDQIGSINVSFLICSAIEELYLLTYLLTYGRSMRQFIETFDVNLHIRGIKSF